MSDAEGQTQIRRNAAGQESAMEISSDAPLCALHCALLACPPVSSVGQSSPHKRGSTSFFGKLLDKHTKGGDKNHSNADNGGHT